MRYLVAAAVFTVTTVVLMTHSGTGLAEAGRWEPCAPQGGYCKFKGDYAGQRRVVRYARESDKGEWMAPYAERAFTGGAVCQVSKDPPGFGRDPAPGYRKACWYYVEDWEPCTHEGGYCRVEGTKKVKYGRVSHGGTESVEMDVTGGIWCRPGPDGFGKDPALNYAKQCWVWK